MKVPSVSKLQIGIACPASVSLPYVIEERGKAATDGINMHSVIDVRYKDGKEAAEKKANELGILADYLLIPSKLFPEFSYFFTEAKFEYNLLDGRWIVWHAPDSKYSDGDGLWTRGVVDLVGWKDDTMYVIDWKTGRGTVPNPETNWQLIVTAIVFRKYKPAKKIVARIVKTLEDEPYEFEYTAEFLDKKEKELVDFGNIISSSHHKQRFKAGEHCRYCPSWVFCPVQLTAIERCGYAKDLDTIIEHKATPEAVEAAVNNIKQMEELAAKGKKKIREYIELNGGEFKLSNGTVLIPAKTDGMYRRK